MEEKKTIKIGLYTAIGLFLIFILILSLIIVFTIKNNKSNNTISSLEKNNSTTKVEYSDDINVVASLDDEITTNSAWCGTFQLVWNDMVNNVVKQDVVFTPQIKMAENLNKQTFTEKELSEKDYYKIYDLNTIELKEKIEKAIKEKFNETSDVLDEVDWYEEPQDGSYIFYTMLKKIFNFENDFDELENDTFGSEYENIKYFGIDKNSDSKLYSQVDVLYYNDTNDFAVVLNTKEGEEVILARGLNGNTFALMYNDMVTKTNNYTGNKEFTENDYLKVPNIKINIKRDYNELCGKSFLFKDGTSSVIDKAIQTIQLDMDKSGGKIKSEAIIGIKNAVSAIEEPVIEHRYFYLNDEFTMFLKESDKDLPYYASNIEDITLFQD